MATPPSRPSRARSLWGDPTSRSLLIGATSAVLIVCELLHPHWSSGAVYQAVAPKLSSWMALHVLLVILFALVALALYAELGDRQNVTATVARVALGLFVVSHSAFIGIDGVATGLIVQAAQNLPPEQQAGVEQALQSV